MKLKKQPGADEAHRSDAAGSRIVEGRRPQAQFVQKTYRLGAEEGFQWGKSLAIAAALEDEELIIKLALGK